MRIGLTGDIAAGKSSVARIFEKLGAHVIDSDKVVARILSEENTMEKIMEILKMNDSANIKSAIADVIFNDDEKREAYLRYLYPLVFQEMEKQERNADKGVFIWEVPLLFEADWQSEFEKIIFVSAPFDVRKKRWIESGRSLSDFERRNALFKESVYKIQASDFVINNDSTIESLRKQVSNIWKDIIKEV